MKELSVPMVGLAAHVVCADGRVLDGRLFVPAGAESRAGAFFRDAGPYTVTVGESTHFEDVDGAVTLIIEGGRLRFNVNLRPVEQRGIRISARMLQLASHVERATPEK